MIRPSGLFRSFAAPRLSTTAIPDVSIATDTIHPQADFRELGRQRAGIFPPAVGVLIVVYLLLVLPTLNSFGIVWDEQTDLNIARSYLTERWAWLGGSNLDPSQTRLPMYMVATALSVSGLPDLYLARLVSCLMGALALVGVYTFGRLQFGKTHALLATAIVACSPFFLAYSRVAMTEGDVFVTAALAWLLVAAAALNRRTDVGRSAITGVALGLAISSKFLAIALLPAVALIPWIDRDARESAPNAPWWRTSWTPIACAVATAISMVCLFALFHFYRPRLPEQGWLSLAGYLTGLGIFAALMFVLYRRRVEQLGLAAPVLAMVIAVPTFLLFPPVHLTTSFVEGALANEMFRQAPFDPRMIVENMSVHALSVLFKPSVAVGIGLWVAFALSLLRFRTDPRVRLPILVIAGYFALILNMKVAQPFYTVALLPLFALLAADRLLALAARRRRLATLIVGVCAISVAVDLWLCFPHYQLNGYQWVGARYVLGRSTVGPYSVVHVTGDGVSQAMTWVNEHARAGQVVKTYINPSHIVRAVAPDPPYTIVDGLRPASPDLGGADYVVTTWRAEIRPRHPDGPEGRGSPTQFAYDRDTLLRDYEPVFRVERPFGLVFATVWRRK